MTQFTPPQAVNKNNHSPKFLSTLNINQLFEYFANVMGEKCLIICTSLIVSEVKGQFHMLFGYLLVLFCDLPVHIFYMFSSWIIWLLVIELCSLDINLCYMCENCFTDHCLFSNFAPGVFLGIDVLKVGVFRFISHFFYGFCILNLA